MARYLSLHTLACLTRQSTEQLAARLEAASAFTVQRVLVNMTEGKMVVECEAAGRQAIEQWFQKEKFHFDWLLRIEHEWRGGRLEPVE